MKRRGVDIIIGDGVTQVDERGIVLQSGRRIEAATVVWSAGVRPAPILKELPLEHARNGGLLVDRDLQLKGRPGCVGIGRLRLDSDREATGMVSGHGSARDQRRSAAGGQYHHNVARQADETVQLYGARDNGLARCAPRRGGLPERVRFDRILGLVLVALVLSRALAGSRSQITRRVRLDAWTLFLARHRGITRVHRTRTTQRRA
ncbi:MAG: FAD-dependent oxidoreductase [Candidatus Eremiobacteraeota bacterium]|nr:FAD-dependent oxidoreductase [Candidatus Eremiobacteraeota bacterium]MBC5804813.1 FAD-dependent oxidoreductase [Candidatus Eremiobacteraeota bacterium]MBC5824597.1 FAD-dependent oxidoreductase [Candidatus Eremiobacteraeota bacterium]